MPALVTVKGEETQSMLTQDENDDDLGDMEMGSMAMHRADPHITDNGSESSSSFAINSNRRLIPEVGRVFSAYFFLAKKKSPVLDNV
jgi:hypothetical protein